LQKTCEAYEWLHLFDTIQTAKYEDNIQELMGYIPFCAQGFHELFAQEKGEAKRSLARQSESWEVPFHRGLTALLTTGTRKEETE
jgi:hypothetical protein